jgi:hypothetical protein
MSILKKVNPKKNEVVRLKFKSIIQILDELDIPYSEADDLLSLSRNMRAYLQGGDFLVSEGPKDSCEERGFCIVVKNHFDHDYDFEVSDCVLESVEIIEDPEFFSSQELNVIVVRTGDELFINGHPLIGNERDEEARHNKHNKYNVKKENFKNKNRKLLKIFEDFITDMAVKDSLSQKGDK